MSNSGFQLANELAVLLAGRNPQWDEQNAYTGAPSTSAAGIDLQDSVTALIDIAVRSEVHRRICDVTMSVLDAGATYTVTVNAQAMNFALPADQDALLIGLRDAILADAVVGGAAGANQIVTAQCLAADGTVTVGTAAGGDAAVTLQVLGTVNADYNIDISATGTGALLCEADAKTASARIFTYPDTDTTRTTAIDAPEHWTLDTDGTITLDYRGRTKPLVSAGKDRAFVEIHTIAGAGDGVTVTHRIHGVWIGPCVAET